MITIPLTQGQVAVIDEGDAELIAQHRWWAVRSGTRYYAATKIRDSDGKWHVVQMQRLIMGLPSGLEVDHKSLDTLDNRRSNLRLATHAQNQANCQPYRNNNSGFKGVYYRRGCPFRPWRAQICQGRKLRSIGSYASPEAAARAYDAKARELHGEFARCNFPLP